MNVNTRVPSSLRSIPVYRITRPLANYARRLGARKYSKCMKTWHEASTSGCCSRELKRNSKVPYLPCFQELSDTTDYIIFLRLESSLKR